MMKTKKMMMTAVSLSMTALFALPALATEAVTEAPTEAVTEAATEAAGAVARASFSIQDYGSGQALTDEQAVALALEHAGVTQDQVERQRTEYDRDDGLSVLEVEFFAGENEYDYTIDLDGGRIISASYDMPDMMRYDLAPLANPLTDSEAADLVLEVLPDASAQDMWIEADRDDGRIYYEIDLLQGDVEYNFDIDADSGTIVSWSQELTDRSLYARMSNSDGGYDRGHHDDDHHDDDWDDWD